MKKDKIIYWIITGIVSFMIGLGSVFNTMSSPESVELISHHLGFPEYLIPLLGVAKLLAIVAILVPGFPRLKEWAYAGLVYDLGGAVYAHISIGAPFSEWGPLLIFIGLLAASYVYHHKVLKVPKAGIA